MMAPASLDVVTPNYIAQGAGPAMLFIHGAGGNAAIWWRQIAYFSERHHALAYDLPGFGRTPGPTAENFDSHFARAAIAVLDDAGVEKASVVAQSLGGWSALRLALEHPHRVERIVLSCTMAGIDHAPALASFQASLSKMDARGPTSLALSSRFKANNPALAYVYDQIAASNPPRDPSIGARVFSPDVLIPVSRLKAIVCPVLIIAAGEDPIWPPAALEGLVGAFPNCRMAIVPGCGHSPYFEQPAVFNDLVSSFMRD